MDGPEVQGGDPKGVQRMPSVNASPLLCRARPSRYCFFQLCIPAAADGQVVRGMQAFRRKAIQLTDLLMGTLRCVDLNMRVLYASCTLMQASVATLKHVLDPASCQSYMRFNSKALAAAAARVVSESASPNS